MQTEQTTLAGKYLVDDLPGASRAGARLNGILAKIDAKEPLSAHSLLFLKAHSLNALHMFLNGEIDGGTFRQKAKLERSERQQAAERRERENAASLIEQAAEKRRALTAYFVARDSDPKFRRQREAKAIRTRFGIGFIEQECYPRAMALLGRVAKGQRLAATEVAWLQTEADDCWTHELQKAWHAIEANELADAWREHGDGWNAVNASGHWRKAGQPGKAVLLTAAAIPNAGKDPKIQSALRTTRGGALRDLSRFDEAQTVAMEAHHLTPNDFRPCTLLGAVNFALGNLTEGHSWYSKAEELGADKFAIDQDLKSLLARLSGPDRKRVSEFLTAQNPERFSWVNATSQGRGLPKASAK